MEKPTILEKLTGNALAMGGLSAIAASVGSPLAALLPVLSGTLAAKRYQARIEVALMGIDTILNEHHAMLNTLTDPQYKLVNEIVLSVLQNTEDEKVEYLRRAMVAGLQHREIDHTIAAQVSRALRDMTAGELRFVLANSSYTIMIGPVSGDIEPGVNTIYRNSGQMVNVSGLMGLGALIPAGSTIDDSGRYVFAEFCRTLKALISEN